MLFCAQQCVLLKERKMLYSSVTTGNFFSKHLSYLRPIFVNFSTEKHLYCQLIVGFEKKGLKTKAERRRNHWRQKRVVFQKTFWTSLRKTRKFRRYWNLFLFDQSNQSKEISKQLSFSGSKVHPLKRNIKDRQRVCFFFVEEMFRVSIVFSCL